MMLSEAIEKATPSDRIVIVNAAGQVIFRGFAANAHNAEIRKTRRVKRYGIGMETYKATERMWDWSRIDALPPQVPVEQFGSLKTRPGAPQGRLRCQGRTSGPSGRPGSEAWTT